MYVWNSLWSEKRWNGRNESMIMYEGIGMDFWVLRGFLGGIVDVQGKKRREEKKRELSAVDINVKLVR